MKAPTTKKENSVVSFLGHSIDQTTSPWYRFDRIISTINSRIDIISGDKWLDVGCQLGQFLKIVKAHYGVEISGIDDFEASNADKIAEEYFHIYDKQPEEILKGWTYYTRRLEKVGFALDERFKVISALEIIEHMVDTDAFIDECREHLLPKGYLVISTPNINSLRNRITVPLGIYPTGLEFRTVIHHVRLYNKRTLVSHLESRGFSMIRTAGVSILPVRIHFNSFVRRIDAFLSDLFPSLCGDFIAVFQKRD